MIFIKYDENFVITCTHYKPFDAIHGLKKTEEELLKEGALVNAYNEPILEPNKVAISKYNPETNEVYFDIHDIPNTELREMQNKISILEAENADLLLDSAMKDIKIKTVEQDVADITLLIAQGGM